MNIDDAKRQSVSQLLFYCARRVDEQARARLSEQVGLPVRTSHTALFPHVDVKGTRLTELARRLGVSKQAVAPLVDELCGVGLLEKVPDPTDGRARLVRFGGGEDGLREALRGLITSEQALADAIGAEAWRGLHHGLLALEAHLRALDELTEG